MPQDYHKLLYRFAKSVMQETNYFSVEIHPQLHRTSKGANSQ